MTAIVVLLFLVGLVIPLVLWLAIDAETSDPTVVDRAEAERIATERGGRNLTRSGGDREHPDVTAPSTDDRATELERGTRTDDADRDDRWG